MKIADCQHNADKIIELIDKAESESIKILVFPELSITGYTCADLFFQSALLQSAESALDKIRRHSENKKLFIAVGMPVCADNQIFNCAVALFKGEILGAVAKTFLPNYSEFYEERWFSGADSLISKEARLCGQNVPIGGDILFSSPIFPGLCIGFEICEDLWAPSPPSAGLAMAGASLILNPSASNDLVTKADYRRSLVSSQSARIVAGYIYASSGICESTTDLVFGGDSMICENGSLLSRSESFRKGGQLIRADIDIEYLQNYRRKTSSYMQAAGKSKYRIVNFELAEDKPAPVDRYIAPNPFVPAGAGAMDKRCQEIFAIQYTGLARRLMHTGSKKSVIAVSGGLDSTLALLCTARAHDFLGLERKNIVGLTMPGFGTTGRTLKNALALMEALGTEIRAIDIKAACLRHFKDIGYDEARRDVTYENVQARERMQIAMDIANMEGGIVVGTGDLSELALGFTTYNGDHMSMYGVNCGIPKTLVRVLVRWVADFGGLDEGAPDILRDVLDTPVSPELLPPGKGGEIKQKTENIVGPYELHDFFLYHVIKNGFSPAKIVWLAELAFGGAYERQEIIKWLKLFYSRFFAQQFKRSCIPDGPKVGTIALSPRGDWRMPSDACADAWLRELDGLNL
jgi:NAD+ synthase (glutamine-hydrolysing)